MKLKVPALAIAMATLISFHPNLILAEDSVPDITPLSNGAEPTVQCDVEGEVQAATIKVAFQRELILNKDTKAVETSPRPLNRTACYIEFPEGLGDGQLRVRIPDNKEIEIEVTPQLLPVTTSGRQSTQVPRSIEMFLNSSGTNYNQLSSTEDLNKIRRYGFPIKGFTGIKAFYVCLKTKDLGRDFLFAEPLTDIEELKGTFQRGQIRLPSPREPLRDI